MMKAQVRNQAAEFRAIRDELYDSVSEAVEMMKTAYKNRQVISAARMEDFNDWYDEKEMFIYNQLKNANKNLDTILNMCMDGKSDAKMNELKTTRDEGVEMNLRYMDSVRELLHGATDRKTSDVYKATVRMCQRADIKIDAVL